HQFEGIYSITSILESDIQLESFSASELVNSIQDLISEFLPHFEPKNVKVTFPNLISKSTIKLSLEHLQDLIIELVLNAYKFTIPNSIINIYSFISEGYLIINIKNDIKADGSGGIPKDYEKLVLEPFIRIQPNDEAIIKIEKFGLGLGLTVVDNVIKKHNGMFFIHNIVDYLGGNKKNCVVAEIFIPIETK
ncbi:MAG: ATP-binding protein, partial [Leptospiraceae bacterium]|nr:ATP-binding protein [Leptospiraceae bacterium]